MSAGNLVLVSLNYILVLSIWPTIPLNSVPYNANIFKYLLVVDTWWWNCQKCYELLQLQIGMTTILAKQYYLADFLVERHKIEIKAITKEDLQKETNLQQLQRKRQQPIRCCKFQGSQQKTGQVSRLVKWIWWCAWKRSMCYFFGICVTFEPATLLFCWVVSVLTLKRLKTHCNRIH